MLKSVVDYLDQSAAKYPDKAAYIDEDRTLTYGVLRQEARRAACGILKRIAYADPVLIYMHKCVECVEAFLAVRYAGGFYVPIDVAMPAKRAEQIMRACNARVVLTVRADEVPAELKEACTVLCLEELLEETPAADEQALAEVRRRQIDQDPIYAIFTSGSTGVPKGVLISERSAINFTECYCETFEFSDAEVFANQTPFYFDASVKDIYATLRCGATMYIVPQKLFSLPAKLVEYLNEHRITSIDWVPSVLCMIVNFKTFKTVKPQYLKKVMFLGEVMPTKQFNMWREALPDVRYANLYGPTEATSDCAWYKVNREFDDSEPIPIGSACDNTEVFLIDEDGRRVDIEETEKTGEICVRGCALALGYYNDPEKTDAAFTRNPFQSAYAERIYHTGDLGRYNSYGEIVYVSRKDFQIKHMGHRIELGEIENAVSSLEGIARVCCLYDRKAAKIIALYEGEAEDAAVLQQLKDRVPRYMMPGRLYHVEALPVNRNGKIDRVALSKEYIKE